MSPTKSVAAPNKRAPGIRHHLDRRAHALVLDEGADDELLTTREVANWLGVSIQFLEIGRTRGYGPAFVKIAQRLVRYKRGNVRAWLVQRTHQSTAEYQHAKAEA